MSIFRRGRGGPGRVTVQEAAARTGHGNAAESGGDAVLLDVREPYEWQAGHAPRAVHLPLSSLAAGAWLPEGAQARPLVVICRSGNRSRQAAEMLAARGSEAVDVIGDGGAPCSSEAESLGEKDWAGAGLPVVGSRGGNGTVA